MILCGAKEINSVPIILAIFYHKGKSGNFLKMMQFIQDLSGNPG